MKRNVSRLLSMGIVGVCTCLLVSTDNAAGNGEENSSAAVVSGIELGAPFVDNAVLQRDMEVPVWGWAEPGAEVTVSFGGHSVTATAGADGKWMTKLGKLAASFEPREMTIAVAGDKIVLKNILVGEVWMASGQSNMQWTGAKSSSKVLAAKLVAAREASGMSVHPIREFQVSSVTAQLHPIEKAIGEWKDGDYTDYSAIAFAFAYRLYEELNVPIAILNCSFSQTAIEAWVPREGWASADDDWSKAIHQKCLETDPTTPEHKEAWDAFYASLASQIAENAAAIKNGEKGKKIVASVPGNLKGNRDANWLFNGRISPVVPYAIRGAIWNQGYANMGKGLSYYNNLHSLIRGWRMVWNQPELPVYFHQFYTPDKGVPPPSIGSTAEMRLGTWLARDIPHTGMASQIDITGGIHYYHKAVPGQRLALHALKNQYGSTKLRDGRRAKDIVADGPMFKSYEVKGDKVIVKFDFADGGLVVADTAFNRSEIEGASGLAEPKIIENGEDHVKLFWLAGADRVWHPAAFEIKGETAIVTAKEVPEPRGISYASGGVGFAPCLYNQALLPMTPFIQYDSKMVTSEWWADEKLKIAGETIDPSSVGLVYEYRKMPLLSVQFRDDAIFQADKPVTIWGSTRLYGEWQDEDEKGDCKVHFEFGDIKTVIPVEPGMDEWRVTLPPMKADGKAYTLKASFTIDDELVHERVATNILFGDVWYVAAPVLLDAPVKRKPGEVDPFIFADSGQIVRMLENHSKRGGYGRVSRFSIAVSRMPAPNNRFAAYWKPASGFAGMIGHSLAAKSKRPVGIIFMASKESGDKGNRADQTEISHWMAPAFLKDAPSTMEDYKTVGSQYPDNPYYLANVRRYMNDWKGYWNDYIPAMMRTRAVPEGAQWGANWGHYPSPEPEVGDSKATHIYNIYVAPFSPAALQGVIFLTGESMVQAAGGANFGPEMAALAKSFKAQLGDGDTKFIYTIPSKELAPSVTTPEAIEGKSQAVEIRDWAEVDDVIKAAL